MQDAASLGNQATTGTRVNGDMLEHTRALETTMASNSDPKFKNSKFLQFLSKMTRGEVILEDNQVRCPAQPGPL
jgi:peroxin-5